MVMPRTPISVNPDDEETSGEGGAVDATMLPPG